MEKCPGYPALLVTGGFGGDRRQVELISPTASSSLECAVQPLPEVSCDWPRQYSAVIGPLPRAGWATPWTGTRCAGAGR